MPPLFVIYYLMLHSLCDLCDQFVGLVLADSCVCLIVAIRSPSKKKTTRQRSLTDPSGAEQHTVSHGASGNNLELYQHSQLIN